MDPPNFGREGVRYCDRLFRIEESLEKSLTYPSVYSCNCNHIPVMYSPVRGDCSDTIFALMSSHYVIKKMKNVANPA